MTQGTWRAMSRATYRHTSLHLVWFALLPTAGMLFYMESAHVALVREFGE